MKEKTIPAAEARKRMEAAESSLRAYKIYLQMAGLDARQMRQQIENLIYELDGLGIKRMFEPTKISLLGDGEYERLLEKYVELLGENEILKKTVPQMPPVNMSASQLRDQADTELQKVFANLKDERDQLANKVNIEKEKRAKAGRRPHIKPEMIDRIIMLHEQGLTQTKVAKEVGYSVFTVNRVIHGIIN